MGKRKEQKNEDIVTGEVSAESQYRPLDEDELKALAIGCVNGHVFGSWMVPEHDSHLLPSIFMVLMLLDDIERKKMRRDGVTHVYEWVREAGPRSINGYPMFMSARMLNAADCTRLSAKIKLVNEALDGI